MAEIRPFRGIRYNPALVKDLSTVICPPYDIIPPDMQHRLHERSEHNFVRVEFPLERTGDDKYQRAAGVFQSWLRQGVLKADTQPAVYVHEHSFSSEGKYYTRRQVLARVRLEEWDTRIVRPHEGIIPRAKSDRLSLLRALEANTSPVLAMYQDKAKHVATALAGVAKKAPLASAETGGERHKLWTVTDETSLHQIHHALGTEPVYIADGHHRYESALTHRREILTANPGLGIDAPVNFVLMALVAFDDPGLVILPPHRLVRGVSRTALDSLKTQLASLFETEEVPVGDRDGWRRVDAFLADAGRHQVRFGLYGVAPGTVLLLTLRDFAAAGRLMPPDRSDLYKELDVSVVDHVILDQLAKQNGGREIELDYSHEREDVVRRVDNGEFQFAFLLNPARAETIKAVADAGERMPRKSTYFYPKAPAGLVVNSLAD